VVDINLNGSIYFARLAVAYLKEGYDWDATVAAAAAAKTNPGQITSSKSITLVSSVAGFKESPGLFAYSAAKHGVLGLMRALRPFVAPLYGLRVNVICMPFFPASLRSFCGLASLDSARFCSY
jgi:NAD(P)-dependent dehydrogenase (short-subunit alcohol dehydrogenase family)